MDKAVEGVIALSIFVVAFCLLYSIGGVLYAAGISNRLSPLPQSAAELAASSIVLTNGNSSSKWQSWAPAQPDDLSAYFSVNQPAAWSSALRMRVYVNATCFDGSLNAVWSKANGQPPAGAAGKAYRFVILDDGTAVRLEVYVK